jgi:type I restriction enzyme S subunit
VSVATISEKIGGQAAVPLPIGWTWVRLGDVCTLNPTRPPGLTRSDDAPTSFVPMAAVDERSGTILRPEVRPFAEVRKGYTHFADGDVLFAKITPCMQNGKHAVARSLLNGWGFGSTEFHVIRPSPVVLAEWIHFFVCQPRVLGDATAHFSGAVGQQRVPASFLADLALPLPTVEIQRGIIANLSMKLLAVERAREAAEAQLAATKRLTGAYLREVYEGSEASRWPKYPLGNVGEIRSGITLGRKLKDEPSDLVPYLRVANVKDGHLDLSDVNTIEASKSEQHKYSLRYGDLLLTEGGDPDKLGRGTYWREEIPGCIHQNHIFSVRFDLSRYSPDFLAAQIGSSYGKRYFLAHAKQTTGIATINQTVLGGFPLLVPTIEEQMSVVERLSGQLQAAQLLQKVVNDQLSQIRSLPSSLLDCAFRGDF